MATTIEVTTTTLKADVVTRLGLTAEKVKQLLPGIKLPMEGKPKTWPVGRYQLAEDDGALTIITVEERDIMAEYEKLDNDKKISVIGDGYKRKFINAPNHVHVKQVLGAEPKSEAKAEKEAKIELDTKKSMLMNMAKAGLSAKDIVRFSNNTVSLELAEEAVRLVGLANKGK